MSEVTWFPLAAGGLGGSLERERAFANRHGPLRCRRYGRVRPLLRLASHGFVNKATSAQYFNVKRAAVVGGARVLRLVILDACRDNPFAPTMQRTIALKLVDKGFSNIEPSTGIMVVYAAKHGETALDGEGNDSPFATALAHDIKEPHVEVRKLFDIVRDDVCNATK